MGERVLEAAGFLKLLRDTKTRGGLDAIKFEPGHPALIMAIQDALHPDKARQRHFECLTAKMLENILRARFNHYKKEQHRKLIADELNTAAEEEAREKREEDVKYYGELGQYKVRDRGVFVRTEEELETGETLPKWLQISRTRIELMAVTRSREDDNWGVYVRVVNMDGRVTRLAIPRNIISRFACIYNGTEVFRADLFPAVAANPFLSFFTVATESGTLEFQLTDDQDNTQTASASIEVE